MNPPVSIFAYALLLLAGPAVAQTEYTYTGEPFAVADPPYSIGDRVTGSITLGGPLSPFMPLTDITTALDDFSFTDGIQSRTPANTNVCGFQVATDGVGNISDWRIFLREAPFPGAGNPVQSLDSNGPFPGPGRDSVGEGPAGSGSCDTIGLTFSASSSIAGTWSSTAVPPPTPTGYVYTGEPFTFADPPYSIGDRVTGSITLAGPLPPFMPLTDLTAALDDFSFTDGVQSRTPANTRVCGFQVATDGVGNISHWSIFLREAPFPGAGNPVQSLESTGPIPGPGRDSVGEGPASTQCATIGLTFSASSSIAGTWSSTAVPPPTPTGYFYTGEPFAVADPPYSIGDRVTGSITLGGPLPPFMPLTDITAALDDFSFDDGVQSRTPANTRVCGFEVATDGVGNISDWSIFLREAPFPGAGNPVQSLDSVGPIPGAGLDSVGEGPASTQCGMIGLTFSASSSSAGSWSSTAVPPPTPTGYVYTGEPFTFADPPYSIGDRVTGSITLAGPLPPFMPLTDLTAALDDFSFTDGVQSRTPANTRVCGFQVATDGVGNIFHWRIFLREAPFPGAGNPVQSLDSVGPIPGPGLDSVGEGPASTQCATIGLTFSASSSSAGTWSSTAGPPSALAIPAVSPQGFGLLALLLAATGALYLNQRRP